MNETATQRWRRLLELYEFDLETSGLPDGSLSPRERTRRVRLCRAAVAASRRVADAADAIRIDATPMLRLAADLGRSLAEAEAGPLLPQSDPGWWNSEVLAPARVVADHLDLREARPKPPPLPSAVVPDPLRTEQDRLLNTAFGRAALELLAAAHQGSPGSWRELSAFNGRSGQRWDKNLPAKKRGRAYDFVRHTLADMVACGLAQKAGPGETKRGGYRITDEGLARLLERQDPSGVDAR